MGVLKDASVCASTKAGICKMCPYCDKKQIDIPLEKLACDEKREDGQTWKWSDDVVVHKLNDLKDRPPTSRIHIVI